MLKSYLLIALRNLKKQRAFSLINIIGMAVGMAGFILFALMAGTKLRADKFHEKAQRIYSMVQVFQKENKEEQHLAFAPGPMAEALRSEFPEIEEVVRVYPPGQVTLKRGKDSFFENSLLFVDPAFLSMFSFKMTAGDPKAALREPYSMVMSEAAAEKYFGDKDPIGRTLTLQKDVVVTVTGVTKNITRTSSIKFDFLVSLETIRALSGILDDWSVHRMATFLLAPESYDQARFEERFPAFLAKYFDDSPDSPTPVRLPDAAEDEGFTMEAYGVDYGLVETLELKMKQGRSFWRDFADTNSLILNEAAVKKLEWENPIGKQLVVGDSTGWVIGVAANFLFADVGFEIPPAVLYLQPGNLSVLLVKHSSADKFPDLRKYIKEQWLRLMPDQPFECLTLSEYFGRIFGLLGKLIGFLNMIGMTAVLLSCLGLMGLATYLTERRTKEIGIRKVLGASSLNIMWMTTREFLLMVAIANAIALGIITYGWNKALQTGLLFITGINPGTYILAVSVSLLTAFLAVSSQTLKAALANPANSLRYE